MAVQGEERKIPDKETISAMASSSTPETNETEVYSVPKYIYVELC
jgi:hypothetical protein